MRRVASASHRIIIKTKTLRIVIKEPKEETLFQAEKQSG